MPVESLAAQEIVIQVPEFDAKVARGRYQIVALRIVVDAVHWI